MDSVTQDDKSIAMLLHFSGVISILGPLVLWILKKDQSQFVDNNERIAINYHLPVFLATVAIGFFVKLFGIFGFLIPLIGFINAIVCFVNGYKAYKGEYPKYPVSIKIL